MREKHDNLMISEIQFADPAVRLDLSSDQELVEIYKQRRQKEALEAIFRRYSPLVTAIARRHLRSTHDVEDACQATFLIFARSVHRIRQACSLASWFYGTAYRTACRLRQQSKKTGLSSDGNLADSHADQRDDPLYLLARKCELDYLDLELARLPKKLREPLVERYLLGKSMAEIAETLDVSIPALDGRIRRGRNQLRQSLARRGIGLSAVLASTAWFEKKLIASTLSDPISLAREAILQKTALETTKITNPTFTKLVEGEMGMHGFHYGKMAMMALAASGLGLVLGFQQWSLFQAGGNDGSNVGEYRLVEIDADNSTDLQLVQFSGTNSPAPEATPKSTTSSGTTPIDPPNRWVVDDKNVPRWLVEKSELATEVEVLRQRLRANKISVDFVDAPLKEVVEYISTQSGVPILIDARALDNSGLSQDEPITLRFEKGIRIQSLLSILLKPIDMTYRVKEEWIEITAADTSNATGIRYYDLSHIFSNDAWVESLILSIERTVNANWEAQGGNDTLVCVGSILVARCSEETHQDIEDFLFNISKQNRNNFIQPPRMATPASVGSGEGKSMINGGMGLGGGMF